MWKFFWPPRLWREAWDFFVGAGWEYRLVSCLPLAQSFVSEVPRHTGYLTSTRVRVSRDCPVTESGKTSRPGRVAPSSGPVQRRPAWTSDPAAATTQLPRGMYLYQSFEVLLSSHGRTVYQYVQAWTATSGRLLQSLPYVSILPRLLSWY